MKKSKIAILTDWYLPGNKAGGPVKSIYSIVTLLNSFFDFYILTTNRDIGCAEPYSDIKPNNLFIKDNIHYYYFDQKKISSNQMLMVLNEIKPDLIYLNSFWSFNFSINIVRLKNKKLITAPLLLAPRGMLSKGAMSLKSLKKNLFLFYVKHLGWYDAVNYHATNQQEFKDISYHFPKSKILTIPNLNSAISVLNNSIKTEKTLRLFYLSRISKVKNLHFALEILKNIPPDIKINYDIFGNIEDQYYWNNCLEIIRSLPKNIIVTYKNELAFNSVQKVISNYNCLFLPTLNENYGHSIVESLLSGCLVIISDKTPWQDLELNNCGFAISLNEKSKFINAIIELANLNQDGFNEKSKAANNYICNKIDLNTNINLYQSLFNEFIKN